MKRNNSEVFSLTRLMKLCRLEMVEGWKVNMLRFFALYVVFLIAFLCAAHPWDEGNLVLRIQNAASARWSILLIVTFVGGALSASFVGGRMNTKAGRISFLMLPASSLEKFVLRWMVFTLGFLIALAAAFKLADWTCVACLRMCLPELKDSIGSASCSLLVADRPVAYYAIFNNYWQLALGISVYLFVQSLYVLGGIVWHKHAVVRTCCALLVICLVYFLIGKGVSHWNSTLDYGYRTENYCFEYVMKYLFVGLPLLGAVLNWVLAYFRFRESETVNRW